MQFTALHRLLGRDPGELTEEIIDEAARRGLTETDDLDWKSSLPPTRALNETDFLKDIAAMANSGGGVIVYGITEQDKKATGRVDVGELTEVHERTLRSAAVTAISPPVFGLDVIRLGADGNRCVAIIVPASVDGPHLIYRNDYFGAPIRNDADTVWMKERQIEAAYRSRFDERRQSAEVLERMYRELAVVTEVEARAWLIAVGRPRVHPTAMTRWDPNQAGRVFEGASARALAYARKNRIRPFEIVERLNPRPGLRRQVAVGLRDNPSWLDARVSIHFDGAVSVAFGLGGLRSGPNDYHPAWEFDSSAVEGAVADFMALVREVGTDLGSVDDEVRVGIERSGLERMIMHTLDHFGHRYSGVSTPMHRFIPVEATVEVAVDDQRWIHQVRELARDCVNQGGVTPLQTLARCECDECRQ
jgi:Putative DNA-binding domain